MNKLEEDDISGLDLVINLDITSLKSNIHWIIVIPAVDRSRHLVKRFARLVENFDVEVTIWDVDFGHVERNG